MRYLYLPKTPLGPILGGIDNLFAYAGITLPSDATIDGRAWFAYKHDEGIKNPIDIAYPPEYALDYDFLEITIDVPNYGTFHIKKHDFLRNANDNLKERCYEILQDFLNENLERLLNE